MVSLAGLRELLVIARTSTLIYNLQQPDPRDVGRTLGVRYVLMGTVRRSIRQVRVSAQLYDAQSAASLWAERFIFPPDDLFEIQDRIVGRVVAGIAPHVRAVELRRTMRKRPENFTAYEHLLRALDCIHRLDKQDFQRARDFLEQAMAIDPDFAMPFAWAARWYSLLFGQGWSEDLDRDADQGIAYATKAIELDPENALALATFGHMKSFLFHDYDTAVGFLERARSICPSSSLAWILSSATMSYLGRCAEAGSSPSTGSGCRPMIAACSTAICSSGSPTMPRGPTRKRSSGAACRIPKTPSTPPICVRSGIPRGPRPARRGRRWLGTCCGLSPRSRFRAT